MTDQFPDLAYSRARARREVARADLAQLRLARERGEMVTRKYADSLARQITTWTEREAACCPEGVRFDEYIAFQARRIAELEALLRAREASK